MCRTPTKALPEEGHTSQLGAKCIELLLRSCQQADAPRLGDECKEWLLLVKADTVALTMYCPGSN